MGDNTTSAPTAPAVTDPEISINNLQKILQIIDVAAERGAFKGPELSTVGEHRDKLAVFLKAVLPLDATHTNEAKN